MGYDWFCGDTPMALTRELLGLTLNRLAYGPSQDSGERLSHVGLVAWVDEQLAMPAGDGEATKAALARTTWPIKYPEGSDKNLPAAPPWPAVDEKRGLLTLDQPIEAVWQRLYSRDRPLPYAERRRPYDEVVAATLVRAVHNPAQFREVLVGFWHDHFNVDASGTEQIAMALPTYDREVIRRHALGNFRVMLEAVATSTAMLYYLSNRSSRAGAANENYARELFELHTMGREAYLNAQYNRWRAVPGANRGHPSGYIDQDVYEAARAFTGWTVADGAGVDNQRKLPLTGQFIYEEGWHDGYQKRILAQEFDPFAPPMADGRKVLDLVANHPATARFMAGKLCRRLMGDGVPAAFVARVAAVWTTEAKNPAQIARVVRFIALSAEFAQTSGAKVKRPLALVASFARATGMELIPTEPLVQRLVAGGQRLFGYAAPTGLPDDNRLFLGTSALRARWDMIYNLAQNNWQNGTIEGQRLAPSQGQTLGDYAGQWFETLGVGDVPRHRTAVATALALPLDGPPPLSDPKRLAQVVAVAAMAPAFQVC